MYQHGFKLMTLDMKTIKEWDNIFINDLKDSYGQEWTYNSRKTLNVACQSGVDFINIL